MNEEIKPLGFECVGWEAFYDGMVIKPYKPDRAQVIAHIISQGDTPEQLQAKARLIAAAPEMYRLLLEVLRNEKIKKSTEKAIEKLILRIDKEENKNV